MHYKYYIHIKYLTVCIHSFKHTVNPGFLGSFGLDLFPYLNLIFGPVPEITLKSIFLFWFGSKINFHALKKVSPCLFSWENNDLDFSIES